MSRRVYERLSEVQRDQFWVSLERRVLPRPEDVNIGASLDLLPTDDISCITTPSAVQSSMGDDNTLPSGCFYDQCGNAWFNSYNWTGSGDVNSIPVGSSYASGASGSDLTSLSDDTLAMGFWMSTGVAYNPATGTPEGSCASETQDEEDEGEDEDITPEDEPQETEDQPQEEETDELWEFMETVGNELEELARPDPTDESECDGEDEDTSEEAQEGDETHEEEESESEGEGSKESSEEHDSDGGVSVLTDVAVPGDNTCSGSLQSDGLTVMDNLPPLPVARDENECLDKCKRFQEVMRREGCADIVVCKKRRRDKVPSNGNGKGGGCYAKAIARCNC